MSDGGPDRGYVLHSYPYKETSLILQVWTERHGRFGIVAKGARRPKSASRSLLVPFQPLSMDWFGRGELKTLKGAEPECPALPLAGPRCLAAFYLNELLLKLTHRDDPHEGLYAAYHEAIGELRAVSRAGPKPGAEVVEPVLRRFEVQAAARAGLRARAHARGRHACAHRGGARVPVRRGARRGAGWQRGRKGQANAVKLRGLTLQQLERGELSDPVTATQAKQLMRLIIHHVLNGEELATRNLARDLQRLEGEQR